MRWIVGAKKVTLFEKSADWEDGGLMSPRAILSKLELDLFYTKRGRGCDWLLQTS